MEFFDSIDDKHRAFIARQPVFFVATAADGARINLSLKGMDSFRVLDDRRVGYLDVGGSGNETNAHLLTDGRITIMFCAFEQPALILRIYGRGTAVLPQDARWGVPVTHHAHDRQTLTKAHAKHSDAERLHYWQHQQGGSIDGLPVRWPDALPEQRRPELPLPQPAA